MHGLSLSSVSVWSLIEDKNKKLKRLFALGALFCAVEGKSTFYARQRVVGERLKGNAHGSFRTALGFKC
jgi:hypothetical protein